jgi:16S rRNA (uracil1498-N3)-methyltransferase
MHRFFLPPTAFHDAQVNFPADRARQLRAVLRLQPGDQVTALDDAGSEYLVELTRLTKNEAVGRILSRQPVRSEPPVPITLFMSLLKKDNFEWVLQKGTEIGAARFAPIATQRTVRPLQTVTPAKMERWQRIIREAAEQSGRGRLPQLLPAQTFAAALATLTPPTLPLIPWVGESTRRVADLPRSVTAAALFIGPEGGFAAEEVDAAVAAGCLPLTLGRRILRAETAAMVSTAVLLHHWETAVAEGADD